MKRRQQNQPPEDPNQLNNTFLVKFIKINYQRNPIDAAMLQTFINFLDYVSDRIVYTQKQFTQQKFLKPIIDIVTIVQYNLAQQYDKQTVNLQSLLRFFQSVFYFCNQMFKIFQQRNYEKLICVTNIYWPLFNAKQKEPNISNLQNQIKEIKNIPAIYQLQTKTSRIITQNVLVDIIGTFNTQKESNFKRLFSIILSASNLLNQNLIQPILFSFQQIMTKGKTNQFQKFVKILINLTNNMGDKHHYIQICMNRIFRSKDVLKNFVNFIKIGQIHLEKYYSDDKLLGLSLIIFEKIINLPFFDSNIIQALKIISKFSQNFVNVSDYTDRRLQLLPLNFVLSLTKKGTQPASSLSRIFQPLHYQKERLDLQGQGGNLDEKILLQYIKNVQQKSRMQQQNEPEDTINQKVFVQICNEAQIVLTHICSNLNLRNQIQIQQIQKFRQIKAISSESIKKLMINVFPKILNICFKVLIIQDCPLYYIFIIKKVQQMSIKELLQQFDFRQFSNEIINQNCLNFHFLLGLIYLKKVKLSEDQRNEITHYLIGKALRWLNENQINQAAVIMNLLLILTSSDIKVSSIQIKIKHFLKNLSLISKPFTVSDFVQISSKQNVVGNFARVSVPERFKDLIKTLNSNIVKPQKQKSNFSNLLMYLIIQFNNIAIRANHQHQLPKFISQINLMKKNNNVNNFYILSLAFNEYLSRPQQQRSSLIIFHFLVKMLMSLQSNNFKQEGIRTVQICLKNIKNFLFKLNSQIDFEYLTILNDRKNLVLYDSNYKKFVELCKQSQIIKFYSQCKQKGMFLNCLISQICLAIVKNLLQVQKSCLNSKLENSKIQEQGNQQVQLPEAQIFMELGLSLKKLNLLYFPYEYDNKLSSLSKTLVQIGLLQTSDKDYKCNQILQNLLKQSHFVSEIILNENNLDQIWNFEFKNKQNIGEFIFASIMRCFSTSTLKDSQIFNLACKLLQNTEIQALAQNSLGQIFNQNLPKLISQRVDKGLTLSVAQELKSHLQISAKLYKIVKKILKMSINQEEIVQNIINRDKVNNIEISEYILKQLLNISLLIKVKTQKITEEIFSYIMVLNQNYPQNKNQLQISIFICSFFNLNNNTNAEIQLKNLEKSEKILSCTNTPTYKCLKCDDKKIICYGCWIACHEDHPVVYVADTKPNRCQCKDISITIPAFRCSYAKKSEPIPAPIINSKSPVYINKPPIMGSGSLSREVSPNIFSYVGRPGQRGERNVYNGRRQEWNQGIGLGAQQLDFEDDYQGQELGRRFGLHKNERLYIQREQGQKRYTTFKYQKTGSSIFDSKIDSVKGKQQKVGEEDFTFQQEDYTSQNSSIEEEKSQQSSIIASQSYLLPIFLQMFTQVASTQKQITVQKRNFDYEKIMFETMNPEKILNSVWKATNPGNYNVRLRRENHLQGKSPSISKSLIAQNPKFILIASGTMISTHLKQKFLTSLLQGKNLTTFPNLNQHSLTFDIHTIDFSPLDPFTFCVAGLHNINLLTINGEGQISKTNHKFNINNEYVNKVRMSKIGIFLSTSNQIKLLNFACKQVLSIKSSSQCLLKEWTVYERANDCIVYCVTSNGYTQFIEVSSSDQGKKVFTGKVIDSRKKIDTGASILVKDCQQAGKVMIGSFKDGSNIIGRLEGDTLQNISNFNIKTNHTEVFGKKIIMGHLEIVKGANKELYVIATVKQLLNNQNTIHQGQLTVFKIKADGKCAFQIVNVDNRCQHFIVVPTQDKNWAILSIHDDGSLQFALLNKVSKTSIQTQCKRIKQIQPSNDLKSSQSNQNIKSEIKRIIKSDILKTIQLNPLNFYRQFSDHLKVNSDIKVIKLPNDQYEVKIENSNKIITGFSLPFLGNVILPHRTIKSTVQIGLSNLEALYYFAQGCIKFKVQKVQDVKIAKDALNQKFIEKLQKLQRLQKLNELSYDGQKASQLINSIKQADLIHDQITYYGLSFDIFKSRIHKFNQIFMGQQVSKSNDQKLEKMTLILSIFIKDSIQKQNYLCESSQIIDFAKSIRKLSLSANQKTYQILKNVMVLALKMYQDMNGIKLHVFNEDLHPLKFATQDKIDHYYSLLKSEISDFQIQQITNFLISICDQNKTLLVLYLAKYPSLLPKLHKKSKKIESETVNSQLLTLYIIGYQVLKFKNHSCQWILPVISTIIGNFIKSKDLRKKFYLSLKNYYNITIESWVKNVNQIDGEENVKDINLVPNVQPPQQNFGGGQLNMMNYQLGMSEMDQEAMLRMALQMSQMDYKRQQEQNFNFENQNIQQIIQEQKQNQPEHEFIMQQQLNVKSKTNPLLTDLIEEFSKDFEGSPQAIISKIVTFYVISKFIIKIEDIQLFTLIMKAIDKYVLMLLPNGTNSDKHMTMCYLSLFHRIFINGESIIKKNSECAQIYGLIKEEILKKLSKIPIENVTKMNTVPCLLGRILKGQKPFTFSHYAYGLVSLLLPPCQPNHILLSLECYWLLPQSKQFYAKLKYKSMILDCMSGGNIKKMHEVAIQHPQIWRQCGQIQWVQKWIQQHKADWQIALDLLTLYYEE